VNFCKNGVVASPLQSIRDLIGKPVTLLVPRILEIIPDISAMTVVTYRPAPVLAERMQHDAAPPLPEIRKCAEFLHDQYGVGFWDAVFALSMKRGDVNAKFVELALLHDASPDERETLLERAEITTDGLERIIADTAPGHGVALSSRVVLAGGATAHIPMLDFHCPHSAGLAALLKQALLTMQQSRGVLVKSPRSYHYYGLEVVSPEGLTAFLARALLIDPLVDARYIAHRLIDGVCRLRLGAARNKGSAPTIEDVIDADAG